jgi:hypothetical protein
MKRVPCEEPAICVSAIVPLVGATAARASASACPDARKQATDGGDRKPSVVSAAAPASIVTVKIDPSPAPASVSPTTT